MIDVIQHIEAIQREVGPGRLDAGEGRTIRLRRTFDAPIDDVWDAFTDPTRISRWFLPISGDYRIGGHYQFEGNAGGEIVACERPNRLKVTWVYGMPDDPNATSEVEVRLTPNGDDRTDLDFAHTAIVPQEMWDQFGPGAVGVGWDMGVLGLALYLATGSTVDDPTAWQLSDEGRDFATRSSQAWGAASIASGTDPEAAAQAVTNTIAFYTMSPDGGDAPG
jgi:uncharacterized protein YndB with AHSA1/START domain